MMNKVTTLEQAARLVPSGSQVILHGGMDWTPMALLREVVRQGAKDLYTIGVPGGALNLDFLIGAGSTATVDTCSLGFGALSRVAPNYERYQRAGRIKVKDNT